MINATKLTLLGRVLVHQSLVKEMSFLTNKFLPVKSATPLASNATPVLSVPSAPLTKFSPNSIFAPPATLAVYLVLLGTNVIAVFGQKCSIKTNSASIAIKVAKAVQNGTGVILAKMGKSLEKMDFVYLVPLFVKHAQSTINVTLAQIRWLSILRPNFVKDAKKASITIKTNV